jgi:hypothetical protein
MDEGKMYRVVYSDGEQTRVKILSFIRNDNSVLVFFNMDKGIEECISVNSFIRSEEINNG